jgi:hypothetical protein
MGSNGIQTKQFYATGSLFISLSRIYQTGRINEDFYMGLH